MKTWTRTFGTALTLALFAGCTVTVGDGNGDDSDDIDFSDKSEEPETTEDVEETTEDVEETTTDGALESTEEATSTAESTSTTSEPATSSTATETSSSPDETSEPVFNACEPEPEPESCNACVRTYCEADWEACCGDAECMAEWTAIYECMQADPSDDPWYDFDVCAASVSTTGDALDLHRVVQYITGCVNAEYMGEPDDAHQPGEGTCTLDCYNWPSLGEP